MAAEAADVDVMVLLEAIRSINQETEPKAAISKILVETCSLLNCDRSTLFMVDKEAGELSVKVATGDLNIRIPITAGIAGHVASTGEKLNIPNAYEDDRFNQATDKKTGYYTHSILCLPVRDQSGEIIAVLQCINKKRNPEREDDPSTHPDFTAFTAADEVMVEALGSQAGITLRNASLFEKIQEEHKKITALLDIVRALHGDLGINSLIFTITERTPLLVQADRCTLYLVDNRNSELWSMHGGLEIRFPLTAGLAGHVGSTGEKLNIPDAYDDDRFNQAYDKKSGYRTRAVLCMPIFSAKREIIGVLQLINKKSGGPFTHEDEQLLSSFLGIAGSILETSQLFSRSSREEAKSEFELASSVSRSREVPDTPVTVLEESDEEESDEEDGAAAAAPVAPAPAGS